MGLKEPRATKCEDCGKPINKENEKEFNFVGRFDVDYIDCQKEEGYCDQCYFKEEFLSQCLKGKELKNNKRYMNSKKRVNFNN